jgi:hypothetical protein
MGGVLVIFATGLYLHAIGYKFGSTHNDSKATAARCPSRKPYCRTDKRCEQNPEVVVVVANWSYPTGWLEDQPFCYILCQRLMPTAEYNSPFNKGSEATSYLEFIIKRYDSLPPYTIFSHGHLNAWHQIDGVGILWNLRASEYTFASINGIWNRGYHHGNYCSIKGLYNLLNLERWLPPLPPDNNAHAYMCCSQFIVSRDRIRGKPIELYKTLYNWLRETPLSDAQSGRHLEWIWHLIFSESFMSERPNSSRLCVDQRYCYNRNDRGKRPFRSLTDFPDADCSAPFATMGNVEVPRKKVAAA